MRNIVKITKVNKNNFQSFIDLVKELAIYEKLTPPNVAAVKRLKKDSLSYKPKIDTYLVYGDKKPVGYMILLMTYSSFLALPTLYIEDLFILKEYRRGGIGQKMFDFIKKLAKQRKCGRIEWTVLKWNKPAVRFYDKNKATPMKDWLFYRFTL
jgi:GNAT superfamily N-acetyltransferase